MLVALGVVASEVASALDVAGGVLCGVAVAVAVSLEVAVVAVAVAVVAPGAVAVGTLVTLMDGVDDCEGGGR